MRGRVGSIKERLKQLPLVPLVLITVSTELIGWIWAGRFGLAHILDLVW